MKLMNIDQHIGTEIFPSFPYFPALLRKYPAQSVLRTYPRRFTSPQKYQVSPSTETTPLDRSRTFARVRLRPTAS
jgi:hypothetical protein